MFLKLVLTTLFSKNQILYFFVIINFKLQVMLTNFSIYFYFEKFAWKTYINLQLNILAIKDCLKLNLKKDKTLQFTKLSGLKKRIRRKFLLKTKKFLRKRFFRFFKLRDDLFSTKFTRQTYYFLSRFFFFSFFSKLKRTWNFLLGNIFPYLAWTLSTVLRLTLPFKHLNLKSNFPRFERISKTRTKNTNFFLKKIFMKNFNYFHRQKLKYSTLAFRLKSLYSPLSLKIKSHFSLNTKPYLFLNSPRFVNYDRQMTKYYWFIFNYKIYQEYISAIFARKKLKKHLPFRNKFRKNFRFSKKKYLPLLFNITQPKSGPARLEIFKNLTQSGSFLSKTLKTDTAFIGLSPSFAFTQKLISKLYYNLVAYKLFMYLFIFRQKNNHVQDLRYAVRGVRIRFRKYFTVKFKLFNVLRKNYFKKNWKVWFRNGALSTKKLQKLKQFKIFKFYRHLRRRLYTSRLFFTKAASDDNFKPETVRYSLKNSFCEGYERVMEEFDDVDKLRENHIAFVMFQSFWSEVRYKPTTSYVEPLISFSFYKKHRELKSEIALKDQKYFLFKILKPSSLKLFKLKKRYKNRHVSFHPRDSFSIRVLKSSTIKKYLNPVTYFTRTKTRFLSAYNGFLYLSSFWNPIWYGKMIPELKKSMYSFATKYETHRYVIKNYYKTQLFEFYSNNFIENRLLFDQTLNDKWHFSNSSHLFTTNLCNIKNNLTALQFSNSNLFETQRTLDFHIKRIKFKPGYRRIWKEARAVAQTTLTTNFRYQKKFTRYLAKFQKYAYLKLLICFEMKLLNILRQSTFLYYNDIIKNFLVNKLVFVNGLNCTNPNFQIFVNDFIQFVISFSYYISYKFIINYFLKRKIKIRIRLRKKNNKASLSFEKKKSSTLPHWLLFEKNLENDVSKFFEIDFFSLSIFIVYEPFLVENLNHYEIYNIKYNVINMYNWKYIT